MTLINPSDPLSITKPNTKTLKIDHFDHLPDSIILLILNKISDVKSLGHCSVVSKRFRSLITQVENVFLRVDSVISDDDSSSFNKYRSSGLFSALLRLFLAGIFKPLQTLKLLLTTNRSISEEIERDHSPIQVLKNFDEIRFLRIELPTGELAVDDGVLLKWRAEFGSTLENCVILAASSVNQSNPARNSISPVISDNRTIPESFYTDGGLKLRIVWTISSLISASTRHYLIQGITTEHKSLESLVITDSDDQGMICMNKSQIQQLRNKPLSVSSASKRTLVPALNMRLWYAPILELPNGIVLKGATLVAIRPSECKKEICDVSLVSSAFDDCTYGIAAKMLVKRKTYCLEMNSF